MSPSAQASTSAAALTKEENEPKFDSIESAIEDIRKGKFVIVLDDENRENEGDLICSADMISTEQMAWFIRHTSGFICISLHPKLIEQIELPMMVPVNTEKNKTAYTITLDYRYGTTTGISAHDRALTSRKLSQTWREGKGESISSQTKQNGQSSTNGNSSAAFHEGEAPDRLIKPEDFCRPGHMCPLRYTEGGVRRRRGHTEASVDLCLAANLPPAALLCELVDPNDEKGGIASRDACFEFAKQHNLKVITIEALERWREAKEGPLPASIESNTTKLDQERGVQLQEQEVVGPAHANGL
ncbi:hypothetical protein L7F22_009342 [Adiantum nelumboides]|nr:hypothetical protein [Adiantum nelumboides]